MWRLPAKRIRDGLASPGHVFGRGECYPANETHPGLSEACVGCIVGSPELATDRWNYEKAYPGLRKSRIEDVCMRVPAGSLLGHPDGSRHTLKSALLRARETYGRRSGLVGCVRLPGGAVARRHVSETVNTDHENLSQTDCHQQGTMVQIVKRIQTKGDLHALQMQMQMQCACRS